MIEMLELYIHNIHCKHIFYACAPDSAGLASLDDYRDNFILSSSITLIKSKPFKDPEVYLPFNTIELPLLFTTLHAVDQDTELRISANDGWNTFAHEHGRSRSIDQRPRSRPQRRSPIKPTILGSTWAPHHRIVLLNINDQRVDSELGIFDSQAIENIERRTKNKRLCAYFHFHGFCANKYCDFAHEPRLNQQELAVFTSKIRGLPCTHGSGCRNNMCFYGHVCPRAHCTKKDCPFAKLHGIDKRSIRVWDESTSSEYSSEEFSSLHRSSSEDTRVGSDRSGSLVDITPTRARTQPSIFPPPNPNSPEGPPLDYGTDSDSSTEKPNNASVVSLSDYEKPKDASTDQDLGGPYIRRFVPGPRP